VSFKETYEWHSAYVIVPGGMVLSGVEAVAKDYNVVASAVALLMIVFGFVLPYLAYYEVGS